MNLLMILMGLYVVLECIYVAIFHLDKGGKFCQFIRYGSSLLVGAFAIHYGWEYKIAWDYAIAIIAVAASLWPATYHRIFSQSDRRAFG